MRYLKDGCDFFGKESYGSSKIALLINRGDDPKYLNVDDTGDELKVTPVKKAFVSLNDSFIVRGIPGAMTTIGLPPKSFVFCIW